MNIQEILISDIKPDPDQPRKTFDDEALERLTQSIKDNGIEQPIIIRQNGKGYIIIDGERRWRAAKSAGLKDMPSIISTDDSILEKQLRSDCLKEGLNVDELDRAIYRYYEHFASTSRSKTGSGGQNDKNYSIIAQTIGKSIERVRKAIDRFKFKRDENEFVKQMEKKHNPDNKKYSKVNSTIAMTDKLKNKPEVRKAVIESILNDRTAKKYGIDSGIDNDKIRKKIDIIDKRNINNAKDAKAIMKNLQENDEPMKYLKNDPRYLFQKQYFEFNNYAQSFYDFDFESVKSNLKGELLKKFIDSSAKFLKYLKNLEE
jgi:ParB/RepB/Spo0J family partition protein